MGISESVTLFRPEKTERTKRLSVEKTPRFDNHKKISVSEESTNKPVANDIRRRLEALAVMNRTAAIAVIGMDEGRSRLDVLYHHAFHRRQMEGMLSLAIHMGEKRIADVMADKPLDRHVVKQFLAGVPKMEETAFLVLDHNGLHRSGRPELFAEGLYLFCTGKENT